MDMHVSSEAAELIENLTREAGKAKALRIDLRPESGSLLMSLADEPEGADTVIGEQGVLVFIGPAAAERLQSQTLHASNGPERSAFFLR